MMKLLYYCMFGVSGLVILFLIFGSINLLLDPYGKNKEALIYTLGAAILGTGLYLAYKKVKHAENFQFACGALGISWAAALIFIIIGVLFFAGPIFNR